MSKRGKLIKTIIWGILVVIMACIAIHSLIIKDYWLLAVGLTALTFDGINFNGSLKDWKRSR